MVSNPRLSCFKLEVPGLKTSLVLIEVENYMVSKIFLLHLLSGFSEAVFGFNGA